MILIGDSSALIALAICDALPLLETLYLKVRVPEAVFDEVTRSDKPHAARLKSFLIDKVISVQAHANLLMPYEIDKGEYEALLLYKQVQAQALLCDDLRARKVAQFNQIQVIDSLGFLLKAKDAGLIGQLAPLIAQLKTEGVFYSEPLIQAILAAADEVI